MPEAGMPISGGTGKHSDAGLLRHQVMGRRQRRHFHGAGDDGL